MANTFNKDFERALQQKFKLQDSQIGKYDAEAGFANARTGMHAIDVGSAANARNAQAGLYNEQAANFGRSAEAVANLNDQTARARRIGANIDLSEGTAQHSPYKYGESVIDLEGGGVDGAQAFSPVGANSYGDVITSSSRGQYGEAFAPDNAARREESMKVLRGYAMGGVVGTPEPMSPAYEAYRQAANKAGVAVLPPEIALKKMAAYGAAAQQKALDAMLTAQNPPQPQGYASGGEIQGPGTGKSDSIPATVDGVGQAAVSDGEFHIPKHVVDYYGTKMLDSLVEKARLAGKANARKPGYAQGGVVKKPASKLSVAEVNRLTPADMQVLHKADMEANQKYELTAEDLGNAAAADRARARFAQKAAMALPEDYTVPNFSGATYGDLYAHLQDTQGRGAIRNIIPASMAPK